MQEKSINLEEALQVADEAVYAKTARHLTDVEMVILRGTWQNQTYEQMAVSTKYTANYLQRTAGPKLWRLLYEALGEEVSKTNLRTTLERRWHEVKRFRGESRLVKELESKEVKLPDSPVPLNSPYYIERPPIELDCYKAILQPGALIRIKAPQQMGKTSLLARIVERARKQDYYTATLSLELADSTVFTDLRKFLQWFCASVGQLLGLPNRLADYWDDIFGCNNNTTVYFEKYLLAECSSPLVLALDKVDWVFEHQAIAGDFCRLLRAWYDMARHSGWRGEIWKRLRLVVVHSTEVYSSLDINHSPLANVGTIVSLPDFTPKQVQDFARRHGLELTNKQVEQLASVIGGHPYLVRRALDYLERQNITLEELLQISPTEAGPFSDHLRQHLWNLQQHPQLAAVFRQVVLANKPVKISSDQAFKLYSMGLVQLHDNEVTPRYDLYRLYFAERLGE
ncbi:MAG: AAA-like domain-containing protein [Oscillatoriaceae bacterium SKW80]|nr:AAA-like domain-containing protein [Oscillatoriaceae bacterium SKYG93]MCX8120224.1 AAA-like domain-containing protein [Oscillatoriaceae bacterium SKW80]MDW8453150.1 AAA-like domain-containing protein [Oscillatoriaceae cyanobacterium SKYGB_i_bin93]HIK28938.1 AAA-like domain-containing protein [Oscillatoriaceae cyanobacterium M7585_C2015_266]